MYDGKASIMVFALDTTESKLAEDKVRDSLREKEVLLREIHHRVKNNLQLIASMLELQAQSIGDKKISETIKEAQNRVWAMAAAHETLYQSGNLAEISSSSYLSRLLMYLVSTMHPETAQVELIEDLEDVPMKIDAAINCGLVLSELIANCYKHAFRNIADGTIEVSLRAVEENRIKLAVRDNGLGLPEGTDLRNLKTFGLNLVSMLVQELRGEMCVKSDGGTEFRIIFPRAGI
jgi:two-component sensor histidine kinase